MEEKEVKRYYYTQLVIWISLVISVIVYVVIGRVVMYESVIAREPGNVEVLRYVFAAFAIAAPMINIGLIKYVLASEKWDDAKGMAALAPFGINNILTGTVNEAVAISGLALFMMAGDQIDLFAFAFLSLAYHFLFMPKYSVLKAWVEHKELIPGEPGKAAGE
jgi:hypothetical protein